jgi:hypothetical protein
MRQVFQIILCCAFAVSCGQTPQKPIDFNAQQIAGSTGSFSTDTSGFYDPTSGSTSTNGQVGATISAIPDQQSTFTDSSDPFSGQSLSEIPGITQTGGIQDTLETVKGIGQNLGNIFGNNQSTSSNSGLFNQNQVSSNDSSSGGLFQNFVQNRSNNGGGLFSRIGNGGGLFSRLGGLFRR